MHGVEEMRHYQLLFSESVAHRERARRRKNGFGLGAAAARRARA
jgi:hypothetical protein